MLWGTEVKDYGTAKAAHARHYYAIILKGPAPARPLTEGKRRAGMGKVAAVGGPSVHVAGGV